MEQAKLNSAKEYLKWRIENDVPVKEGYLSDYISFSSIETILNELEDNLKKEGIYEE